MRTNPFSSVAANADKPTTTQAPMKPYFIAAFMSSSPTIVLPQCLLAWSPSYTANSGGIEQASEQSANLTHEWHQVPEVIGGGRVKAAKLHALHACQRGSSRGTCVVTALPCT